MLDSIGLQSVRLRPSIGIIGMKTKQRTPDELAAPWQRVIQFQGELTPGAARALLQFQFSARDHARMDELSAKARAGALSGDEQAELDTFERLGCVLDIVHSRARRALKKKAARGS
jgi:hypothetical protein